MTLATRRSKRLVLGQFSQLQGTLLHILKRQFPSIELSSKSDAGLYLNSASTILAINDLFAVPCRPDHLDVKSLSLLFQLLASTLSVRRVQHQVQSVKRALVHERRAPSCASAASSSSFSSEAEGEVAKGESESGGHPRGREAQGGDGQGKGEDGVAGQKQAKTAEKKEEEKYGEEGEEDEKQALLGKREAAGVAREGPPPGAQVVAITVSSAVEARMLRVHWAAAKLLASQLLCLPPSTSFTTTNTSSASIVEPESVTEGAADGAAAAAAAAGKAEEGGEGDEGKEAAGSPTGQLAVAQSQVVSQLEQELSECVTACVVLAARPACPVYKRVLTSATNMLSFLLLLCPRDHAESNEAAGLGTLAESQTPTSSAPASSNSNSSSNSSSSSIGGGGGGGGVVLNREGPWFRLAVLALSLIHHRASLCPSIVRCAARLGRRLWPSTKPAQLWAAFVQREEKLGEELGREDLLNALRRVPACRVTVRHIRDAAAVGAGEAGTVKGGVSSVATYLVSAIGAILCSQSEDHVLRLAHEAVIQREEEEREREEAEEKDREGQAVQAAVALKKRALEKGRLFAKRLAEKEAAKKEVGAGKDGDGAEEAEAPVGDAQKKQKATDEGQEEAEEDEGVKAARKAAAEGQERRAERARLRARYPDRRYSLVAHRSAAFRSERWSQLLAQPALYELVAGQRGAKPERRSVNVAEQKRALKQRQQWRKGGNRMTISSRTGAISANADARLTCTSGFSSVQGSVSVTRGKWFYQALLGSRGLMQVGWAKRGFRPHDGDGVGDDACSWAYDGYRIKRWHGASGASSYGGQHWAAGDVVGCAIDLDASPNTMTFYLNGKSLGVAFSGFDVGEGLFPAASISRGEAMTFIFDPAKFRPSPGVDWLLPPGHHPLVGDSENLASMPVFHRASRLAKALATHGSCLLLRSSRAHCRRLAARLSALGAAVSVAPSALCAARDGSAAVEAGKGEGEGKERVDAKHLRWLVRGEAARATCAELVGLARALLQRRGGHSSPPWADSVKQALLAALLKSDFRRPIRVASPAAVAGLDTGLYPFPASPSASAAHVLGACCVLGGFSEPLRLGGLVRVNAPGSAAPPRHAVLVDKRAGLAHCRVAFLGDLASAPRAVAAVSPAAQGFTPSATVERRTLQAVGDLAVTAADLPLNQELFAALSDFVRVPARLAELEKEEKAAAAGGTLDEQGKAKETEAGAAEQGEEDDEDEGEGGEEAGGTKAVVARYKWLMAELQWRAVAVLNTLVRSASIETLPPPLLSAVGSLLLGLGANCPLGLSLEDVMREADALRGKLWELRNGTFDRLAPPLWVAGGSEDALPAETTFVETPLAFGEFMYGRSAYREVRIKAEEEDDKMVRYWDKHIIPVIKSYVRGSFRPYEMENFFAQLRQPLRQGDNAAAVNIAFTLCAQHLPEGVTFPADDKDFDVMAIEDICIGQRLLMPLSACQSDVYAAGMESVLGCVGVVKAVQPGQELVQLQFVDAEQGHLNEFWLAVESLKPAPALGKQDSLRAKLHALPSVGRVYSSLSERLTNLSHLLARRTARTLLSSGDAAAFLASQLTPPPSATQVAAPAPGSGASMEAMGRVFHQLVLLAVSEGVELQDVDCLGQATDDLVGMGQSPGGGHVLKKNVRAFLRTHGSHAPGRVREMVQGQCRELLETAATFALHLQAVVAWEVERGAGNGGGGGGGGGRGGLVGGVVKKVSVFEASSLVLLFSTKTRLPEDSRLAVYADGNCTELLHEFRGSGSEPSSTVQLGPVVVPRSTCYIKVIQNKEGPVARGSVLVIPVHPSLGLALWSVGFILSDGMEWAADGGPEEGEGGEEAFLQMLLEHFDPQSMPPSPLKEALLRTLARLLNRLGRRRAKKQKQKQQQREHGAGGPRAGMAGGEALRESLSKIRELKAEAEALHKREVSEAAGGADGAPQFFTSYLQNLLELLVTSDSFRVAGERLCPSFHFPLDTAEARARKDREAADAKAAAAAAAAAVQDWGCGICTFLNPLALSACSMCGSPRPAPAKPKAPEKEAGGEGGADVGMVLHNVLAVVDGLRVLARRGPIELVPRQGGEAAAVSQSVSPAGGQQVAGGEEAAAQLLQAAWRECGADHVENRLYVLSNIPTGPRPLVKRQLLQMLRLVSPEIRVRPEEMFLCVDPRLPRIPPPPVSRGDALDKVFSLKRSNGFGEQGILYHLGTHQLDGTPLRGGTADKDQEDEEDPGQDIEKKKGQQATAGTPVTAASAAPSPSPIIFRNPHDSGHVIVTSSSSTTASAPLSALVGDPRKGSKTLKLVSTKPSKRSWIMFEFPHHTVAPTHYAMRHPAGAAGRDQLRGWLLEGSRDGKKWSVLKQHRETPSPSFTRDKGQAWDVTNTTWQYASASPASAGPEAPAYSMFRVTITHPNSSTNFALALGGFELFGKLTRKFEGSSMGCESNVVAVIEVLNTDPALHASLQKDLECLDLPLTLYPPLPAPAPSPSKGSRGKGKKEAKEEGKKHKAGSPPAQEGDEGGSGAGTAAAAAVGATDKAKADREQRARRRAEKKEARMRRKEEKKQQRRRDRLEAKQAARRDTRRVVPRSQAWLAARGEMPEVEAAFLRWKLLEAGEGGEGGEDGEGGLQPLPNPALAAPVAGAEAVEEGGDAMAVDEEEQQAAVGGPDAAVAEAAAKAKHPPLSSPPPPNASSLLREAVAEVCHRHSAQASQRGGDGDGGGEGEEILLSRAEFERALLLRPPLQAMAGEGEGEAEGGFAIDAWRVVTEGWLEQLFASRTSDTADTAAAAAVEKEEGGGVAASAAAAVGKETRRSYRELEAFVVRVASGGEREAEEADEGKAGAVCVSEWLQGQGYDVNLQHGHFRSLGEAFASQQPSLWPRSTQQLLMRLLGAAGDFCGQSNLLDLQPTQLRFPATILANLPCQALLRPGLADASALRLPVAALRLRFLLLRKVNALLSQLLPLVDLRRPDAGGTAAQLHAAKDLIFRGVKLQLLDQVLGLTAEDCGGLSKPPVLALDRRAAAQGRGGGGGPGMHMQNAFEAHSLFSSAMRQLKDVDAVTRLRPRKPAGTEPFLAFEVLYQGEHVVGEGGPYRQFFTDVGAELQDAYSPLLRPCPNRTGAIGDNRDKFLLAASATGPSQLAMFEFLGLLFGVCVRTGVRFPLDLPAFVWKALIGRSLTRQDLVAVDAAVGQRLSLLESTDDAAVVESLDLCFVCALSDGAETELKPDGANVRVTHGNRMEYVRLVLAARLTEHQAQVEALRRGMSKILPLQLLNILTWQDLELVVCGKSAIDVALLRRHTQYSDGLSDSSPHVQMLWDILEQFDQPTRRKFIRFAWAQERIPADDAAFVRSHTRLLIKPSPYKTPDLALPRADTCFFNLELPAYSSKAVMREKLLYAINTAVSMNADEAVQDLHGGGGGRSLSIGGRGGDSLDDWLR